MTPTIDRILKHFGLVRISALSPTLTLTPAPTPAPPASIGMSRKKARAELVARVVELRDTGLTHHQIALQVGKTAAAVSNICWEHDRGIVRHIPKNLKSPPTAHLN